jgi:hypothetical protein
MFTMQVPAYAFDTDRTPKSAAARIVFFMGNPSTTSSGEHWNGPALPGSYLNMRCNGHMTRAAVR